MSETNVETDDDSSLRVIAIDGPAGAGKSTIARALAARLGLEYLDTGAMYRAVTFAAMRRGIVDDAAAVAALAEHVTLEVGEHGVLVDGVDATVEIRSPEVTSAVSRVAANSAVRSRDASTPARVGSAPRRRRDRRS